MYTRSLKWPLLDAVTTVWQVGTKFPDPLVICYLTPPPISRSITYEGIFLALLSIQETVVNSPNPVLTNFTGLLSADSFSQSRRKAQTWECRVLIPIPITSLTSEFILNKSHHPSRPQFPHLAGDLVRAMKSLSLLSLIPNSSARPTKRQAVRAVLLLLLHMPCYSCLCSPGPFCKSSSTESKKKAWSTKF